VSANADLQHTPFTCEHCGQQKTVREGTYATVKDWLLHGHFKQQRSCYACHFPPCPQCGQVPEDPLPSAERVMMRQRKAYVCPKCSLRRCLTCDTVLQKANAATQYCSQCIAQQRWQVNYDRLLEAIKANHGVMPYPGDDPKRLELLQGAANWCREQGKLYSSQTLNAKRCHPLEQIPGWSWEVERREEAWRAMFAEWQHYYAKHCKDPHWSDR